MNVAWSDGRLSQNEAKSAQPPHNTTTMTTVSSIMTFQLRAVYRTSMKLPQKTIRRGDHGERRSGRRHCQPLGAQNGPQHEEADLGRYQHVTKVHESHPVGQASDDNQQSSKRQAPGKDDPAEPCGVQDSVPHTSSIRPCSAPSTDTTRTCNRTWRCNWLKAIGSSPATAAGSSTANTNKSTRDGRIAAVTAG